MNWDPSNRWTAFTRSPRRRDDPFYTQTWSQTTRALIAIASGESELFGKAALRQHSLALSTMRTALEALLRTSVLRQKERHGQVDHVLEDPLFGVWVRLFVTV